MPIHIHVEDFAEEFAESIRKIDVAMQSIAKAGIKEETIVTLIKDYYGNGISKVDIRNTLKALNRLKEIYLKKEK